MPESTATESVSLTIPAGHPVQARIPMQDVLLALHENHRRALAAEIGVAVNPDDEILSVNDHPDGGHSVTIRFNVVFRSPRTSTVGEVSDGWIEGMAAIQNLMGFYGVPLPANTVHLLR